MSEPSGARQIAEDLAAFIGRELLYDRPGLRVDPDADLFAGGLLDSVALMGLVTHVEEEYRITVRDEELVPETFGTVSALAAFVASRRPGAR